MRDPIKIGRNEYLPVNATVLCVCINGSGITIGLETKAKVMDLQLPISTGIVADLCRIMGVDDIAGVNYLPEGPIHVRALALGSWSEGVSGIAHLIEDIGLSAFDYYVDGDPKKGMLEKREDEMPTHGEEETFYMSTLEPPPGLPWLLRPDPVGPDGHPPSKLHLIAADGSSLGIIRRPLAEWLTKKAQLATLEE